MYCKAQLHEISQIRSRNEHITNLTHGYTNSRSERRSGDTAAQVTHPFDKTKRSLLNHLESLGFALKNLIKIANPLAPGGESAPSGQYQIDNTPCEQDVCRRCHSHRSTLVSETVTSENMAWITQRGGSSLFTYGMSAIGLSDDIGGKGADGVDSEVVGGQGGETGHRSQQFLEDDGEVNREVEAWSDRLYYY